MTLMNWRRTLLGVSAGVVQTLAVGSGAIIWPTATMEFVGSGVTQAGVNAAQQRGMIRLTQAGVNASQQRGMIRLTQSGVNAAQQRGMIYVTQVGANLMLIPREPPECLLHGSISLSDDCVHGSSAAVIELDASAVSVDVCLHGSTALAVSTTASAETVLDDLTGFVC